MQIFNLFALFSVLVLFLAIHCFFSVLLLLKLSIFDALKGDGQKLFFYFWLYRTTIAISSRERAITLETTIKKGSKEPITKSKSKNYSVSNKANFNITITILEKINKLTVYQKLMQILNYQY